MPLIGAGFSRNAEGLKQGQYMPLWGDLGLKIEEILQVTYNNNPTEVISEFVTKNSKIQLVEYLTQFLHHQVAKPGDAHKYLVRLPFEIILTTNFDNLLEEACIGVSHNVVYESSDLSRNIPEEVKIVKLHGDLNRADSVIITSPDYERVLSGNYSLYHSVIHWLMTKTLFIIGYRIRSSLRN